MTARSPKFEPVVGERYRLDPPWQMPWKHPLRRLHDDVMKFKSIYDSVDGKDPVTLGGIATVQVRGTGYTVDPQPPPSFFGLETEPDPKRALKRPVPGVLVHLARWSYVQAIVEVPTDQVIQLGLDPAHRYFVRSLVWTEANLLGRGEEARDKVIVEADLVIPVRWLCDLDATNDWESEHQQRTLEEEARRAMEGES